MYLKWQEKTITDFSEKNINELYSMGFLFTRAGKGEMYQTRSVRVDLSQFELSSENRRILRKTEDVFLKTKKIPYQNYSWEIGKFGKDYYETKFGKGIFTANKIKELLTDDKKSNFNLLLEYYSSVIPAQAGIQEANILDSRLRGNDNAVKAIGYAICYSNDEIIHYSYPFYSLSITHYSLGMSMMTKAIIWAKENNKKFVYLGSAKNAAALYKFQFKGVEWWDGKKWKTDMDELKKELK